MSDNGNPAGNGRSAGSTSDQPTGVYIALGIMGVVVGLGGLLFYSMTLHKSLSEQWRIFGIGLGVSAAAATVGGLAGFLFGIPRRREGDGSPVGQGGAAGGHISGYLPNTNLEQVSDWFTKMLVGIGLVEFGRMGVPAGRLVGAVGKCLGGSSEARVVAACLLVLFLILGFMVSYLWTATNVMMALRAANAEGLVAALSDKVVENDRLTERVVEQLAEREVRARGDAQDRPRPGDG
ncbi:hypothetical protein [Streptomyces sp. UNOB3_S3]|uniref:hypothetical protein n=1 Tax=Streptomyces sp. UNOB3_S3 TaxID=2871682 RepID=UPI001E47FCC8|nr:hypothetical protein [Streptomyces sp. UNOB3_S3]MCC3773291.1 hypothetical protein [Streptomyces sp. UNOB3_S3]